MLRHGKVAQLRHDGERCAGNGIGGTLCVFRRTGHVICAGHHMHGGFGGVDLAQKRDQAVIAGVEGQIPRNTPGPDCRNIQSVQLRSFAGA